MHVLLVVNTRARHGGTVGQTAAAELARRGVLATRYKRSRRHAAVLACDAIVVVGGDGTLLRVLPMALAQDVPVGIVPAGTFNELARTLQIPLDPVEAAAVVAEGNTRGIDVGVVNGVHFLNEASIGISSRAARLQSGDLKRRFGFAGIVATAVAALRASRPMFAEVEFEGRVETFKTLQLTVANSHRFGGIFDIAGAAIDDGWLDLYSVEIGNFRDAFRVARAMLTGHAASVPGLRALRAKQFGVRQHREHRITADGEPAGTTPATFRVLPKALRVFVPH